MSSSYSGIANTPGNLRPTGVSSHMVKINTDVGYQELGYTTGAKLDVKPLFESEPVLALT